MKAERVPCCISSKLGAVSVVNLVHTQVERGGSTAVKAEGVPCGFVLGQHPFPPRWWCEVLVSTNIYIYIYIYYITSSCQRRAQCMSAASKACQQHPLPHRSMSAAFVGGAKCL